MLVAVAVQIMEQQRVLAALAGVVLDQTLVLEQQEQLTLVVAAAQA
jgi:hypothetical protein